MGRFSASRPLRSVGRSRRSARTSRSADRSVLAQTCRGDERVHFSPSRTSRPVGCRLKVYIGVETEWRPSGCFRSDPQSPGLRSPDGIRSGAGPRTYDSRPARRKCLRCFLVGVWGLVPRLHRTRSTVGDGVLGQTPLYARRRRLSFGYFQDPS